jgi:hypothetical protein
MPSWLESVQLAPGATPPGVLVVRLGLALALGFVVAWIYERTNGGTVVPSFRATLVLLAILIAAVTQVIGDNVARAFSLVGALSIVRFRTVVQDTRDTAYVIFAVTVGMAVGAGDLWVAGLSLVVIGIASVILSSGKRKEAGGPAFELAVTLPLAYKAEAVLQPVFDRHVVEHRVTAVSTVTRGACLETTYQIRLRAGSTPASLVHEVNELEGIQSVQIRVLEA